MPRTVAPTPSALLISFRGKASPVQQGPSMDPRIADATLFMRGNCHNAVTVLQLASQAKLSYSRFEHLFRQQTGQTFHAALADVRLAKAADLLADRTLRIKEVAAMCGYGGSHSFGKAFRKRFGLMPSAYRRSRYGYQVADWDTNLRLTA